MTTHRDTTGYVAAHCIETEEHEEFRDYLADQLTNAEITLDDFGGDIPWQSTIPPRGEWYRACNDLISRLQRDWQR